MIIGILVEAHEVLPRQAQSYERCGASRKHRGSVERAARESSRALRASRKQRGSAEGVIGSVERTQRLQDTRGIKPEMRNKFFFVSGRKGGMSGVE